MPAAPTSALQEAGASPPPAGAAPPAAGASPALPALPAAGGCGEDAAFAQAYRLGYGFAFRHERFGGVIHHFEGRKPDPRVYFLRSSLLVQLLERIQAQPALSLGALLEQAASDFGLQPGQRRAMEDFLRRLIQRGALRPAEAASPQSPPLPELAGAASGGGEAALPGAGAAPGAPAPAALITHFVSGAASGGGEAASPQSPPIPVLAGAASGGGEAALPGAGAAPGAPALTALITHFVSGSASGSAAGGADSPAPQACAEEGCGVRPRSALEAMAQAFPQRAGRPPAGTSVRELLRHEPLSSPLTVTWEVTNRCNLRCTHCLSDSGPEADCSAELSTAEALSVVEQLAAEGVFQIHFGGGEPFARADFMQLLAHARAQGFCCLCISTNGYSLSPRRIAQLEALGGVYLQLSLDGASQETCDALRGAGVYRTVLRALERVGRSRLVGTLNFVYCRQNAHELEAMHAIATAHGATLRVTRLKPSGRGAAAYQRLRPTQQQLVDLHAWLQAHDDVLTGDTFFHLNPLGTAPLKGAPYCGAGRMTALIIPDGRVYPCAFTQTEFFAAGSLRTHEFGQIWRHSAVFNDVFRGKPEGPCTSCESYAGCGGGCPAVKHALHGHLNTPDPDCVLETAKKLQLQPALCQA